MSGKCKFSFIVTIHTAGLMYRQTRHGTWPRLGLGLGLGLEFVHGWVCASLLTFLYTRPASAIFVTYTIIGNTLRFKKHHPFYPHNAQHSAVFATATCLSICPSHAGIVSKTVKPILKRFRPSGSAIILVFSDPCADTHFQGNPFSGGAKSMWVGKIGDYRLKAPFISEMVQDRPIVTMER